jgi:hypothetical protein
MRTGFCSARWIVLSILVVGSLSHIAYGAFDFDYFGLEPPGLEKRRFNPSLADLEERELVSIHFTPDGTECYLSLKKGGVQEVFLRRKVDGVWSGLEPVTFPEGVTSITGFSPDGNRLYFLVRRGRTADVYVRTRTADGWSAAERLPEPVNHEQGVIGLSVGAREDLYFCSWRSPGQGACDVWRAKCIDGVFSAPENLAALNTATSECSIVGGLNDRFVIFYSWRPGGFGQADLYVSFPKGDTWTPPRNLGPRVNTAQGEVPQTLSPDEKYLFFYSEGALCWIETKAILPVPEGSILNADTEQRFGSLQCAIHYANSGDTIVIGPGTCWENLDLGTKNIVLRAADANDPDPTAATISEGTPTCRCAQ